MLPPTMPNSFLPERNAFSVWAHVPSEEVFAGSERGVPVLSIVIPTYRRYDLLVEAVRSAIAQDADAPFEVVVVDDDPASEDWRRLIADVSAVRAANFRYLRNTQNLGMYGNINRAAESARGEWVSILHDDDLIDTDFAREMLADLQRMPKVQGLVCQKRGLDQRSEPFRFSAAGTLARRWRDALKFRGKEARCIGARQLFWGCLPGNTVGFMCRVDALHEIGGFHLEEHPSCDYFYYARFAERFGLYESRKTLASIRVSVNSLTKKSNQIASLRRGLELQLAYAGTVLPRFWRWFTPLVMARQVAATSDLWRSNITKEEAEQAFGIRIAKDRPLTLYALRALLGGY